MLNLSKYFNERHTFKYKGLEFLSLKHYYLYCLALVMASITGMMKVSKAKLEDLDTLYEDLKTAKGYFESLEKDAFNKFYNDLSTDAKLLSCISYLQSKDVCNEIDICPLDSMFIGMMIERHKVG